MNFSMAISLGHNSSAVLISPEGKILAGYETERFDKIKSSSRFPYEPIKELLFDYGLAMSEVNAYIGHWFTSGNLPETNTKHCDLDYLNRFNSVDSLGSDFTHHDSHLESAKVFAGTEFFAKGKTIALVMDGFGTMGECISIYEVNPTGHKLLLRSFGYANSLGMLYQYATDFMGMKMNNHEYKILAYEVHIHKCDVDIEALDFAAHTYSKALLSRVFNHDISKDFDPIVNTSALQETKKYIHEFLYESLNSVGVNIADELQKRICTAYLVQKIVEIVTLEIRKLFPSDNLLLVGGLFYNVKLNSLLCDTADSFCVMPLAGDQGAALGVYQSYKGNLQWPEHLFWGHRDLYESKLQDHNGILTFDYFADAIETIESEFNRIGFVNLVRGSMEFGPRALCNTSTLAIPDENVTTMINKANDRTAEMPMAPVMTYKQASELLSDIDKVHKSLEYMILTRNYKHRDYAMQMLGAAHYYPDRDVYTARPQISDDKILGILLDEYGPLVNTSFNYHGYPIVHTTEDIIQSHKLQNQAVSDLDIKTIVITKCE